MNLRQLTIGELLALVKEIPTEWGLDKSPVDISFDFGSAYPIGLSSWRGSYDHLAINYSLSGYDDCTSQSANRKLKDFVLELESSVGKQYTGWKGGDYTMTTDTLLWVDNDGNCNYTGVVGIVNEEYKVIIKTAYFQY